MHSLRDSVGSAVRQKTKTRNIRIIRQFKLAHLLVAIALVAFVLGARSLWLTSKNPNVPHIAPILFGCIIAIVAERTIRHFSLALLLACIMAMLQFALYSWESIHYSEKRDFPHVITYHYAGDLDLHMVAGIVVLIGTIVLSGGLVAIIRYLRPHTNTK